MTDATNLNILTSEGKLLCPACGFPNYASEPAYDRCGGITGITICACCLWEPGYDDEPHASADARDTILDSLHAYRVKWRASHQWRGDKGSQPPVWDGEAQLAKLFELAPYLRP